MFENAVDIAGVTQKTFATGAQYSEKLEAGVYDVWGENDIYIKVDRTLASDVTTGTGYIIKAGNIVPVRLAEPAFLGAAGTGAVYFHKVA